MSQDDPNQPHGEDEPQPEAPGPKAPQARPPGVPPLDTTKIPRAAPGADPQRAQTGNGTNPRNVIIAILVAAAVVCIVIVFAANSGGGKSQTEQPSSSAVTPPTESTPTTQTSSTQAPTQSESTPTTTETPLPKPTSTEPGYSTEASFEINETYNIDKKSLPSGGYGAVVSGADWGPSQGNDFGFISEGSEGKVAPWNHHGHPTFAACKETLASATLQHVPLEEPGHWICVETPKHRIGYVRYDGSSNEEKIFNLFISISSS